MAIKVKETEYKGYRFRSRLEARWAVFFDALDIDYEYEPEGFVLSNGQSYLPDFYLPCYNVYVEVKHKNNNFISHPNDEIVTFGEHTKYGYFMHEVTAKGYGVWFVFGDPVDALLDKEHGGEGTNELFCNCICSFKALKKDDFNCSCGGEIHKASECTKETLVSGKVAALDKEFIISYFEPYFWTKSVKAIPFKMMTDIVDAAIDDGKLKKMIIEDMENMFKAFKKSRQARFEHGEKPFK